MKLLKYAFVAGSVALLAACGGNSSIGTPTPVTSAPSVPSVPSGTVTRFVGTPRVFGAADGMGAAASFGTLGGGLATDSSGNIYVADWSNYTIRKITPAGLVTTLAGTPAEYGADDGIGAAARFSSPTTVAVDSSGNVYVGDGGATRKITAAGVVTTLGTYGSVVADPSGNLYFFKDNAIQKYTGGVVTTLAGTVNASGSRDGTGATARFGPSGAITIDSMGNNIFVSDNMTIRRITSAGEVTTLAGTAGEQDMTDGTGAAARFHGVAGMAVDSRGNVYVSEMTYTNIRKITSAGVVTTLAGSPFGFGGEDGIGAAAQFFTPFGVTIDSSGNILVFDRTGGIRKIAP